MSKKRSKHHTIANAQKRKKRNKQSFWNRVRLPGILARAEEKKRKAEAKEKRDEALKEGLKKIEITPKKQKGPQKKGKTR